MKLLLKLVDRFTNPKPARRRYRRLNADQSCEVLEVRTLLSAVADRFENNNIAARAKNIQTNGRAQTHSIHNNGRDVDWIKFRLTRRSNVTIETNGSAGDTRMWLYGVNNSRRRLKYNDDGGNGYFSKITRSGSRALGPGTYYVKISEYGSNHEVENYTVSVNARARTSRRRRSNGDRYENDNISTRAKAIQTNGRAQTHSIHSNGRDVDWVKFTLTQRSNVTIKTDGSAGDTRMWLYGPGGSRNLIEHNDDGGNGSFSKITRTGSGTLAAGTYYVKVDERGRNNSIGRYTLSVNATAVSGGGGGESDYTVTVRYTSNMSQSQRQIFQQAAARWSQIIVGDLPDATWNGVRADDLVITASTRYIDGVNGILGQAGPTRLRNGSLLPSHGIMQFDSADMNRMENNGTLFGVILHEMGHVIGIGTIWNSLNLVRNVGNEIRFTGQNAAREYNRIFGTNGNFVPVETGGGAGTRGGHWSENVFDYELMTGWANGRMPISRVTVGALADMGYRVNLSAADAYTNPNAGNLSALQTTLPQSPFGSSLVSTATTSTEISQATILNSALPVHSTAPVHNQYSQSLTTEMFQSGIPQQMVQADDAPAFATGNQADILLTSATSSGADHVFPHHALDLAMVNINHFLLKS